jgi:hypothetical protein
MRESVPVPLLVLESCILDDIDCADILVNIPVDLLVKWESDSSILKEGLTKMNWWEQSYPTCFERLSFGNWRELLCKSDHRVWKESLGSVRYAFRYDELGSDEKIHQLVSTHVLRTFVWRNDSELNLTLISRAIGCCKRGAFHFKTLVSFGWKIKIYCWFVENNQNFSIIRKSQSSLQQYPMERVFLW